MAKSTTTTGANCVGFHVDARDKKKLWAEAKIVQCNLANRKVKVHFVGWSKNYDVWAEPKNLAPHGSHAPSTAKGDDVESWDGDMKLFNDLLNAKQPTAKSAKETKSKSKAPTKEAAKSKAPTKEKAPAKKKPTVKAAKKTAKHSKPKSKKVEAEESDAEEQPLEEPASEVDDVPAPISKRRKTNDAKADTINVHESSVSIKAVDWSDIKSMLTNAKAIEHESIERMHAEDLEWEKEQFRMNMALEEKQLQLEEKRLLLQQKQAELEERRVALSEEEARCRMQLVDAQTKKEKILAQREELSLKMDHARSRKRLRDEGVPEDELNELLPLRAAQPPRLPSQL